MLLRRVNLAQRNVRNGKLGTPVGQALAGRTVCLYGLGHVAEAIAMRLSGFKVRLLGLTRNPDASKAKRFRLDRCYEVSNKKACFAQTDVLIVCVRHTDETRNLIREEDLRSLRPGALVINIARAGLIDREGLQACVFDGHLGGVGLDVFWHEPADPHDTIFHSPNVIATPHVAGITDASLSQIALAVSENITRFGQGALLRNRVV
jgi:phosphoglycerate dehydrogenase-like enzyme